jgi:hypothetical protein
MRKLVLKTALFSLPVFIIGILIEFLIRDIPNDYDIKKDQMIQVQDDVEILILGNSHAFYGINPIFFEKRAYNMAYFAQPLVYDKLLLEKFIDHTPNLKLLFLNISYPSLSYDFFQSPESFRAVYYHTRYGLKNIGGIQYNWEVTGVRLKENLKNIKKFWSTGKLNSSTDENGWGKNYSFEKREDLELTGKKYAKFHTSNSSKDFFLNKNNLEGIVTLANEHKVKVILYTSPLHFHYRNHLSQEQWGKNMDLLMELSGSNNNVEFWDFSADQRFSDDDFFDADHLNNLGAEKFSKMLNEMIQK